MSATKDVEDLVRAINATGRYRVESNGPHHKVKTAAGSTVYTLPRSPGDHRWRENAIHELISIGVFEHDPRKNGGKKPGRGSHLANPEIQALKIAATKERAKRFADATAVVRERLQPLITKVGGWGAKEGQIAATELAAVAMHWGRDRADVFSTIGAARSSAQGNMRHNGACAERALGFWDAFVTEWEAAEDPRRWYFDLAREMKGLSPTQVIIGGQPVAPPVTGQKNLRRAGRVKVYRPEENRHPLEPAPQVGLLALRAVLLMASGSAPEDSQEILDVGEEILALEAQAHREEE